MYSTAGIRICLQQLLPGLNLVHSCGAFMKHIAVQMGHDACIPLLVLGLGQLLGSPGLDHVGGNTAIQEAAFPSQARFDHSH